MKTFFLASIATMFLGLAQGQMAEATNGASRSAVAVSTAFVPPVYPTNVHVRTNVPYLGADRAETADIYSPLDMPRGKKLPAVLIIHGGGFNDGDKARPREINIATNLVLQGYICMSINYLLRKKQGDVTWPQSVHDAKAAVRWLRRNAAALQVDPERIGVIGCSAGGNLAAMLALTQPKDGFDMAGPHAGFSSAVSCAIDFYGAVKLMEYHDMKMFNKTRAEAPELYEKASPVNYAHKNAPPILIVHGTRDETVPLAQSEALADALSKAGAEYRFVVVTNAPHTFNLQPRQEDLRPLVFEFFGKYLKPGRAGNAASTAGTVPGPISREENKTPPVFPPDVRIERDVQLFPENKRQKADLYFPLEMTGDKKLPGIVWIHGGGWSGGARDAAREISVCSDLARNGYVVMSVDYLLSDKKQTVWPTNLWDCKAAVRWFRKNAARLGVEHDRIGVAGGSAGGHLAAMVALTAPVDGLDPATPYGEISCAVKCCVDFYGISDIGTYHDVAMLGQTFAENPELYRRASPVTYVCSNSVPFLLLHGTADTTVKLEQSQTLAAALSRHGVPHELAVVTNGLHSFHLRPPQADLRPVVFRFLDKHLKP